MRVLLAVVFCSLSACSPPVMFSVVVDEEIRGGTLTLNGKSAPLMSNVGDTYWAKWGGSDASGQIELVYPDGARASCEIGYVTNGMGVQYFEVTDRQCSQTN